MRRRWFAGDWCNRGKIVGGPFPSPNPNDVRGGNQRWIVECWCGRRDIVYAPSLHQASKCVDCRDKSHKSPDRLMAEMVASEVGIDVRSAIVRIRNGVPDLYANPHVQQRSKWRKVYGKTLQELADERGITREAVRQRIEKYGHPGPATRNQA